ncbi:serine/threonine-protein kinase [Saccharopolyspora shandongensis]|uniref:WD40 repeat domain-containing serine/threonine protein kinase n=1 Tax=Saccharopolyspora shandongensis TaxID=418495 RepID=UPI00341A85D3
MRPLGPSGPREVGQYRVLAELGRGGMGRVLLGSGPDGRLVALKLVHDQFAEDDGFRARFRREVEASRAVSGAYTAAVIDADPDAPTPWLASVFVPGPSLHETAAAIGALPEESVLRLAAGLTTALVQIHRAGLVHRDLKPSNVLLAEDGPRVIDFGIVRAVNGDRAGDLTRAGWLVGSPEYMSPEQAKGEPVTSASDVFSLGSVVVAACTGASPFTDTATLQTLNNVVLVDPDLSGIPGAVRRIVEPCLAKDPAERPTPVELLESIGQIAPAARPWLAGVHRLIAQRNADIARILDASQVPTAITGTPTVVSTRVDTGPVDATREATAEETPPTRTEPTADGGARRRLLGLGVAAVALALVGVLIWALQPPPQVSSSPPPQVPQVGSMAAVVPARRLLFSPDGRTMATVHQDSTVQLWNVAEQRQVGQIIGPLDGLNDLVFSPDSRTLIAAIYADSNASVRQWDVASGAQVGQHPIAGVGELSERSEWLVFSPDASYLAVSYSQNEDGDEDVDLVRLWEVAGGQPIGDLTVRNEGYNAPGITFSPDGRTVAISVQWSDKSGSENDVSAVILWDLASRRQIGDPISLPRAESLSTTAFGPDGRVLMTVGKATATTSDDETASASTETSWLRLWDLSSRNQIRQPSTIPDGSWQVPNRDGSVLAIKDNDTVRLWNVAAAEQIGPAIERVNNMVFSPDGRTLATAGEDGVVRLWSVPAG